MPKVLHLIDHNGLGGAQRLVAGLLEHRPGDLAFPLRTLKQAMFAPPVDYPQSAPLPPLLGLLQKLNPLRRWLEQHPVDIIHCHLQAAWMAGICLHWLAPRPGDWRLLFHEHNPYILYSRSYPYLARLAARIGKMITVSNFIGERMRSIGIPAARLETLPNYVAGQFFADPEGVLEIPLEPGWRQGAFVVGYAGRLVEIKGWDTLLQVIRALPQPNMKFLVAGTGKDEERLRKAIVNHHLESKVHLLGFVTDMSRFYHTIDALLFPSLYEVFGLTPLEAQAAGVPVIAAAIPAVKEIINPDNALLIPPGDVPSMAAAIQRLASDPELSRQLIVRGAQNARRYTLAAYLPQLEQIYRSLAD